MSALLIKEQSNVMLILYDTLLRITLHYTYSNKIRLTVGLFSSSDHGHPFFTLLFFVISLKWRTSEVISQDSLRGEVLRNCRYKCGILLIKEERSLGIYIGQ